MMVVLRSLAEILPMSKGKPQCPISFAEFEVRPQVMRFFQDIPEESPSGTALKNDRRLSNESSELPG
jgi:hypothetical protein